MFCEAYRQPLSDAALSGELTAKLSQHLDACASCRTAFAQEQSLFVAIDSGVQLVANAEVPATLLPRIRVALNSESAHGKPSQVWLFAAAPLVVVCVLVFAYLHSRGSHSVESGRESTATPATSAATLPAVVNTPPERGVITVRHNDAVRLAQWHPANAKFTEIIVEPQEAAALSRYELQLKERSLSKSPTLLAKAIELPSRIQPLEIAELEERDLKIPALAKAEADGDRQ